MPFTVVLLPTDASPPPAAVARHIREVIATEVGSIGKDGVVHPANSPAFAFDDHDFYVTRLSPLICRVVFHAAQRTNSYMFTSGRGGPTLLMKGSSGNPPADMSPAVIVGSPTALCRRLAAALVTWNRDFRDMRAEGIIDAHERPIGPLASPDPAGVRLAHDTSGVVEQCEKFERERLADLHWTLVRTLVTSEPKWGVVWRADVATGPDRSKDLWRDTCWSRGLAGKVQFGTSSEALMAWDPEAALAPLPER